MSELLTENEQIENLTSSKKATESFVFMDDVAKILDIALTTEKNVILYGKGGYGKSDFTLNFLREKGINPYIITMGTGMTTDRLFGGLDIKTFNETGKIEYLVENSFMNHEYVIFEELFDAPDFILEQLKDILSSGEFRMGGQVFPIVTKTIVCCTNKTREEFSKNNSLKALMERFPLETKVEWKDHNKITYEKLFKTQLGFSDPMLTYILEQFAINGSTISPRIAITAADIIEKCGPEALTFIADFNAKSSLLKESITKFESVKKIRDLMQEMEELSSKLKEITLDSLDNVKEASKINKLLLSKVTKLKGIKADDSLVTTTADGIKKYDAIHKDMKKKLDIVMAMEGDSEGSSE